MKHAVALSLSIALFVTACSKESVVPAAAAAKPASVPADLLVDIVLPSIDQGLAGVRQFANGVQPGAGLMISERKVLAELGVGTLDGAAGDRPVHILVVQPEKHPKPIVVVVGVADITKLRASAKAAGVEIQDKNGVAILGAKPVVNLLGGYALTTLSKSKPEAAPVAIAYSGPLLAAYRELITTSVAQMKPMMTAQNPGLGDIMDVYVSGLFSLLESSERLEIRVAATAAGVDLDLAAAPRKGSKLASFIAAQKASNFKLLERLPSGPSSFVMAGRLVTGPLRADVLALFEKFFVTAYGLPASPELTAVLRAWADSATGDFAGAGELGAGRMRITQLLAAKNPGKAHTALGAFFKKYFAKDLTVEIMGVKSHLTARPDAAKIEGVSFHRYTSKVDTKSMTPEAAKAATAMGGEFVNLMGAWDDVLGVSMNGDDAVAKALVETSRGKGSRLVLPAELAARLSESRARKESVFYYIDFGRIMAAFTGGPAGAPAGMVLALGFADGSAHMRFGVKLTDVKAFLALSP